MNIRRWSVGVVAAALLVPGVAACNSGATDSSTASGSSAAAVPKDPKEALVASTKGLAEGNFSFTVASESINGSGSIHKPSNSAQMAMKAGDETFTMEFDVIQIDSETWVKMDLGELLAGLPGMAEMKDKYQYIDAAKAGDAKNLDMLKDGSDPANAAEMFKGLSDVQETGPGTYSGKVDMTAATDSVAADEDVIKALGDQAKQIPFTAKLDDQGRLIELVISVPAAGDTKAQDVTIKYADYGAAKAAQKPPADQVVEANEQTYEMFK
ncbi:MULTISPECIES: hypothetical protein [Micromonospora]|uniref:hypothetical protein n=1 Tax=Micromonospora TaxID=1873 RepID=UPI0005B7F683|nr:MULTISPECIES: hypothetical protein [Micromonospora]RUL92721.1 hypothetical protein EG812_15030 [Verrucosispora sp. FIM060022]